jgi:hypothetical protein
LAQNGPVSVAAQFAQGAFGAVVVSVTVDDGD